jgi:hypothetical protein
MLQRARGVVDERAAALEHDARMVTSLYIRGASFEQGTEILWPEASPPDALLFFQEPRVFVQSDSPVGTCYDGNDYPRTLARRSSWRHRARIEGG